MIKEIIKLLRVKHYLKNLLIFLPLFFSGNILKIGYLKLTLVGFLAFCLMASVVYIINDVKDAEKDRKHEVKKNRPIASGKVSKKLAIMIAIIIYIVIIVLNVLIIKKMVVFEILNLYLLINIGYSFGLKKIPIIDIVILSFGFLLRVIYGAAIINLNVSNWLLLTVMTFAFYLSLGKRRNEIIKSGSQSRDVLKYYNREFLDKNMYMCLSLAIVFYSLWCIDSINSAYLMFSVAIVIMVCMRYNMIIEGDSYGDPVDVVTNDKMLLIMIAFYAFYITATIYGVL